MSNKQNPIILICDCESREHQMVIEYEGDYNMIFCHIHLAKRNFWRRIIPAIKYIFGYTCKYGHFEEFIFKVEHIDRLQKLINILKRNLHRYYVKDYHDVNEFYPENEDEELNELKPTPSLTQIIKEGKKPNKV